MWPKSFALCTILAISYPLAALAQGFVSAPGTRTIEVTGHGEAEAKPDTMILSFGVESEARTPDECTRLQAERTAKVVDAFKARLGSDAKIETSDFTFNPQYTYGGSVSTPVAPGPVWTFKAQVTAYSPTLDTLGALIEAGMAAGATGLVGSGVEMQPQDEEPSAENQRAAVSSAAGSVVSAYPARQPVKKFVTVSLDVQTDGSSPDDVVRRGAAIERRVEQAMRDKLNGQGSVGLAELEIARANPTSAPPYQPPPQAPQLQGYAAHTTVTVETHDLNALGSLIETGIDAGAKQFNQVSFTLREDSDARKQGIEKAAEDAKSKAATLARSMGVKLGSALRISTNAAVQPQVVYGHTTQQGFAAASLASSMPVIPHQVGYSADVTATYQIE